jgi:DNA-binding transcriptional MerR regulator
VTVPAPGERHLSIGEVLTQLRDEFPDVTISKIRFLESQGLIDPERTPSGYRKFYSADLDRLRWILFQQREHFLPLRVIKERLDASGSTGAPEGGIERTEPVRERAGGGVPLPRPRVQAGRAAVTPPLPFDEFVDEGEEDSEGIGSLERPDDEPTTGGLSRSELLEATGLLDAQLDALEEFAIVEPVEGAGERARYDDEALTVAELCAGYYSRGIEARHLKMYQHFAEREAALFAQVILPHLRQRNPSAREKAQDELEELARLGRRLRTAMLRRALLESLGG